MKDLIETKELMCSADYKKRFVAEYWQNKIRYDKLVRMVEKWDAGTLEFTPTCPRELYDVQLEAMATYLNVLVERAKLENVNLLEEE